MKNYYEILEVDRNASDEIIKVAYKSLVKKYHPDLKNGQSKIDAESKIKQINEAYDTLSDPIKKNEYDRKLISETISKEEYISLVNENNELKRYLNYYQNMTKRTIYPPRTTYSHYQNMYNENISNSQNTNNLNNNVSKKNFFNNLSEGTKTIFAVLLTFLIVFIVLKIPFIRDWIMNFLSNGYFLIILIVIIGYIFFFRNKK